MYSDLRMCRVGCSGIAGYISRTEDGERDKGVWEKTEETKSRGEKKRQ